MSFSESENENRVMLLTLEGDELAVTSVPVPVKRKLLRLFGSVDELKQKLQELPKSNNLLRMFIELDAVEENHDPNKIVELETLAGEFRNDSAEVLKYRIRFINQPAGTASLYDINVNIEDLKPLDVFDRKLENENLDEETSRFLREAFSELLEEVFQKEEEK
jgi:exonuclease SbcD